MISMGIHVDEAARGGDVVDGPIVLGGIEDGVAGFGAVGGIGGLGAGGRGVVEEESAYSAANSQVDVGPDTFVAVVAVDKSPGPIDGFGELVAFVDAELANGPFGRGVPLVVRIDTEELGSGGGGRAEPFRDVAGGDAEVGANFEDGAAVLASEAGEDLAFYVVDRAVAFGLLGGDRAGEVVVLTVERRAELGEEVGRRDRDQLTPAGIWVHAVQMVDEGIDVHRNRLRRRNHFLIKPQGSTARLKASISLGWVRWIRRSLRRVRVIVSWATEMVSMAAVLSQVVLVRRMSIIKGPPPTEAGSGMTVLCLQGYEARGADCWTKAVRVTPELAAPTKTEKSDRSSG